ncbi:MAG: hypothetical protein ILO53_00635, partial [Clostridia bacterium]|nr:hypothetical protein [Clostridia bacterium]
GVSEQAACWKRGAAHRGMTVINGNLLQSKAIYGNLWQPTAIKPLLYEDAPLKIRRGKRMHAPDDGSRTSRFVPDAKRLREALRK